MFLQLLYDLPGSLPDLFYLSDSTFYHLLGLLAVTGFLRLFIPLHCIMTKELQRRNEVADLAEEKQCTEFDIFVAAHKYYFGSDHPARTKNDFITYLCNWPDNYILPFYIRIYLAELKRDNSVSGPALSKNQKTPSRGKLKNQSIL